MPRSIVAFACAGLLATSLWAAPAAVASEDRLILTPLSDDVIYEIEGIPRTYPDVCPARQPGPLFAKYRGTLEIVPQQSGRLRIINELPFPDYLAGLAEVPLSWPKAALRAQVIAARSYALDAYRRGRADAGARGYDICSTDVCQVYRGAAVELGAFGERWRDAIAQTAGRVLRHDGRVIQAFYFSTSDGRTRSSFPGGTPQPWLPSVDGMDEDTPLGHWRAPIRLRDLTAMLRAEGVWTSGSAIERVADAGDDVRLSGGGSSTTISKSSLRSDLNVQGICLFSDRYPNPTGSQTGTRLPQVVPSSSFRVEQRGARAIVRGRGWGHFVGMSQWGAHEMAQDGASTAEILRHYYGAARVGRVEEPGDIRVLAAEDLRQVRIRIIGDVRVTTGTGSELAPGERFTVKRGNPPVIERGKGPRQRGVLEVRHAVRGEIAGEPGARVRIPFVASRPVRVTVRLLDAEGTLVTTSGERSFESGERQIGLTLATDDGPLAAGTYRAVIEGYDGLDRVRTAPVQILVGDVRATAPPAVDDPADDDPGAPSSRGVPIAIGIGALLGALALGLRFIRR